MKTNSSSKSSKKKILFVCYRYGETVIERLDRNAFDWELPEENISMVELYEATNSGYFLNKLKKCDGMVNMPGIYDLNNQSKVFDLVSENVIKLKDNKY